MQVKDLANSLALIYNFYSSDYNSFELAEDYGWKDRLFCVSLSVLCVLYSVFSRGLAIVQV